jgi:hypothetical protein
MKNYTSLFALMALIVLSMSGMGVISPETGRNSGDMDEGDLYSLYLPLVAHQLQTVVEPPLLQIVITSQGGLGPYASSWVNGYVTNPNSGPVYSAAIGVELLVFPYCGPDEPYPPGFCDPFEWTHIIYPAFPATLPGQVNPFFWSEFYGKSYADVTGVKVSSASFTNDTGKTYSTLTVLEWHLEDQAIVGKVRNDRGEDLENIRVVVFSNRCDWKEATLDRTGLKPGMKTDFRLDFFFCTEEDVQVLALGTFEP